MYFLFFTQVYLKLERYDDVIKDCDAALKVSQEKFYFVYYFLVV